MKSQFWGLAREPAVWMMPDRRMTTRFRPGKLKRAQVFHSDLALELHGGGNDPEEEGSAARPPDQCRSWRNRMRRARTLRCAQQTVEVTVMQSMMAIITEIAMPKRYVAKVALRPPDAAFRPPRPGWRRSAPEAEVIRGSRSGRGLVLGGLAGGHVGLLGRVGGGQHLKPKSSAAAAVAGYWSWEVSQEAT